MVSAYFFIRLPLKFPAAFSWSWWWESNPQPRHYECRALPLSHISIYIFSWSFAEISTKQAPKLDFWGCEGGGGPVIARAGGFSTRSWPHHYECAALPLSHSSKSIIDLTVNYDSTFFSRRQSPTLSFLCLLLYYLLYIPVLSPLCQSRSAFPERTCLSSLLKFLFGISSKRLLFLRL